MNIPKRACRHQAMRASFCTAVSLSWMEGTGCGTGAAAAGFCAWVIGIGAARMAARVSMWVSFKGVLRREIAAWKLYAQSQGRARRRLLRDGSSGVGRFQLELDGDAVGFGLDDEGLGGIGVGVERLLIALAGDNVGGLPDFERVAAISDVREVELACGADCGHRAGRVVIGVVEFDVTAIDGAPLSSLRTVPEMGWSLPSGISMRLPRDS